MKILSFSLCALFASAAVALAQNAPPPQGGPTLLPDPSQLPAVPPGTPGHDAPLSDEDSGSQIGLNPLFLEIGEGERVALPRPYGQSPCAEAAVRKIFRDQAADDFLATLRCWRIPSDRSSDFVRALDGAVAAAGWDYTGGAGMQTHYAKGGKQLDVLIFGFDQFGDPDDASDDAYVGYLFGVYDADRQDADE